METQEGLLASWHKGIRIAHVAHRRAAAMYHLRSRLLGVPAAVLATIVGTSVFASLGESPNQNLLLVTGVLSVLAAILASLQTFLDYSNLGTRHHTTGVKFGLLRRRLEELLACDAKTPITQEEITSVREEWGKLEDEAPELPQYIYNAAEKRVSLSEKAAPHK